MKTVGQVLFIGGVVGMIINRGEVIRVIICIEMMLSGVIVSMVANALWMDDVMGQVFGIVVVTVAAGEAVIGLGLVVRYHRIRKGVG